MNLMEYLKPLLQFLIGTYAKFGTTSNLFREVVVSVLTAVAVAVLVQILTPTASPISEVTDLIKPMLASQHLADSLTYTLARQRDLHTIDSLKTVILKHNEQDSIRHNAALAPLDAIRKINRAINKK